MTDTAPAAGQVVNAAGVSDPVDQFGQAVLGFITHRATFAIAATALLVIMLLYRLVRKKSIGLAHCLKLVEGVLGVYLGVTIWIVFAFTNPPAIHVIGHEMRPYVGLVTLLVMLSFALPALKHAFQNNDPPPPTTP